MFLPMPRFFSWSVTWLAGLCLVAAMGCGGPDGASDDAASVGGVPAELRQAFVFYQEADLNKATELAAPYADRPLGKLLLSLCRIHNHQGRDIPGGLDGLREIFEDTSLDPPMRGEAGVAYGRVIFLYRQRGMYQQYDEVDLSAVFRSVREMLPRHRLACTAAHYEAEMGIFNQNPEEQEEGFSMLEEHLRQYAGAAEDKVPLHLVLDRLYIVKREDYARSVEHLMAAYDIGITNPTTERSVVFRIGRTSEKKLNNPEQARRYYEIFLRDYPYSRERPMVLEALQKMGVDTSTLEGDI